MVETVKKLLADPCNELLDAALACADTASDSDRRMAITLLEDYLQNEPARGARQAAKVLIALRRAAA